MKARKITTPTRIGFIAALLLTATACGGSAPPTDAPQTPATPQGAEQAVQQLGQSVQQMTQNQAVTVVDFEKLVALLPEPAGWTRGMPKGSQVNMGIAISRAEADYEKGDSSIKLEITDTSFSQMMLAPFSMMLAAGYSERSSDGYKKYAALGGSPGFESWENEPRDGEVTVIVANRFIVSGKGRNVDNIDLVRRLVQAVDLAKLAALK